MLIAMKSLILMVLSATMLMPAGADPKADVMATMDAWAKAAAHKDRAALDKLYHPDLIYAHSSGLQENKEQAIKHMVDPKGTVYEKIDFAETTVRVYGNMALVTGKVIIHERAPDGKKTDVNLLVLHNFLKGPQGWQMIGRQATRPTS
jgi:ketosteroid isomerase-like protein